MADDDIDIEHNALRLHINKHPLGIKFWGFLLTISRNQDR